MVKQEHNKEDNGIWLFFIISFFVLFSGIVTFNSISDSPENLIIGEWSESVWSYELRDSKLSLEDSTGRFLSEEVKSRLATDLLIHKSEHWVFEEPDKIRIYKKNGEVEVVKWRLAGRGHILKLIHENGQKEIYDIKEINADELIINFDMGLELRGVAKLSFRRKKTEDAPEV